MERNYLSEKGGIKLYVRRFISATAALVSIGICIFITWISKDVDQSTIIFNLVFLGGMLLMVGASVLFGLGRLMSICRSLRDSIEEIRAGKASGRRKDDPLFQNDYLDDCYLQYQNMSRSNPNAACDIRNFINEELIESYVHRGILELIPDILTSLGILGTFVGLVMGLQEFDPSGYEQMAGSVTPLINGIKVAFITSIYGISLSLAFSFNLRSEFSNLSSLVEEFLDTWYLHVAPPYEVDSFSRLLEYQRDREDMTQELTGLFVQEMSKSFTKAITPAFEQMNQGIERIVTSFTKNQERAMTQICETVIGQMRAELSDEFSHITQTVAAMEKSHENYTDFMDHSMARMQQTLLSMQDNMKQASRFSAESLEQLEKAYRDTYKLSLEQKATYQEYIRFMYQSIEEFSAVWEKNSAQIQGYSDEIAKMGPVQSNREILTYLESISLLLQEIQKQQKAAELKSEMSFDAELEDMMDRTLRKLDNLEELVSAPRLFRAGKKKKSS